MSQHLSPLIEKVHLFLHKLTTWFPFLQTVSCQTFIESFFFQVRFCLFQNSEVVMPQPFTNFDEEVDTGVMCQICDCWLSGRREFDRHCEQRHPIVVDADSTTVVHRYFLKRSTVWSMI